MGRKKKNKDNGNIATIDESLFLQPPPDPLPDPDAPQSVVENLLNTVPPDVNDCYLKIYKTRPLPAGVNIPVFKSDVRDLRNITDLEVFTRNMAAENNWGSGEYLLQMFAKNDDGYGYCKQKVKFEIDIPEQKTKETSPQYTPPPPPDPKTQIRESLDLVRTVQELTSHGPDPTRIVQSHVEALTKGIELGKSSMAMANNHPNHNNNGNGHNNNGNTNVPPQPSLLETIAALKNLGLLGSNTSQIDLLTLLKAAKELVPPPPPPQKENPPPPPQQDPFNLLVKFAEMGIIELPGQRKDKPPEDPISTVEKVAGLVTALQGLPGFGSGGGGGDKSPTIALIETLGPQLGKIVESITDGVKSVARVQEMKLHNMLKPLSPGLGRQQLQSLQGSLPQSLQGSLPPQTQNNTQLKPELMQEIQTQTQAPAIQDETHPIVMDILNAVYSKDVNFYPQLEGLILMYVNEIALNQLVKGRIPPKIFLYNVAAQLKDKRLQAPECEQYLRGFVEWMKSRPEEESESSSDGITVYCTQCGVEYDYPSLEIWNQELEENQVCDECQGKLQLKLGVITQSPTEEIGNGDLSSY